jgi:hypothetical protein
MPFDVPIARERVRGITQQQNATADGARPCKEATGII